MTYADNIFKRNLTSILTEGVWSQNARPVYADGSQANSKYITNVFEEYNLAIELFPLTTLRPIAWKTAIKEMLWIYQDQTADLNVLRDKYDCRVWDQWELPKTSDQVMAYGDEPYIGIRYGATVRRHNIIGQLLDGLAKNPWNRRNIITLWQYDDFYETDGLLPCAFSSSYDVRQYGDDIYLDAHLHIRSSDYAVAGHWNRIQYVALQLMIAKHFGWKPGKFTVFTNNLHIYSNQFEQVDELLSRTGSTVEPRLVLDVPDKTDFYDIKPSDFKVFDYEPVRPQILFPDLAV